MSKYKTACVGAVLAIGSGCLASVGVMAESYPTSCTGIDNCEVINSSEDLNNFFTTTSGRFVTREGKSTMIIGADFSMPKDFYIENSDITMYLGGHTISADECSFLMYNSNLDIYGDGEISNAAEGAIYAPLYVRNEAEVTLHSGVIRGGLLGGHDSAVNVQNGGTFTMNDGEIHGASWAVSVYADSEFVMNGGMIMATDEGSIGVSGNGTADPTKPNYGANAKLTLNGGTIFSNDLGVYAPQVNGVTTLGSGLTILAAKAGVEVRAGELLVDGATIYVPVIAEYEFNPNGNGSTASGVAIAVAQHTTKQPIRARILSGEFRAPVVLAEANPQHNPEEAIEKVEIEVTGGTFEASSEEPIVTSEDVTKFVSGGIFSKEIDGKYIRENYSLYPVGDDYVVLKTMTPDGSDESESDDKETAADNEKVLETISDKVMHELIEGFLLEPTKRIFETADGYKFSIDDDVDLADIMTSGATISTNLVSSPIELDGDEEALIESAMSDGMVEFGIMDFSIELKADGILIGRVTEIPKALSITFDVLGAPEIADEYTRTWNVLRLHGDSVTMLDADYNSENGSITAESNEFSTFVAVYTDKLVDSEPSNGVITPDTGAVTGTSSDMKVNAVIVAVIVAVITGMAAAWKLVIRRI